MKTFLSLCLVLTGCTLAPTASQARRVQVPEPSPRSWWESVQVRAQGTMGVVAGLETTVSSIPVALGQNVQEGTILVELADHAWQAVLGELRAQLQAQNADALRLRVQMAEGWANSDMQRRAEEQTAQILERLHAAERAIEACRIPALSTGTVARVYVSPGDAVGVGQRLLDLRPQEGTLLTDPCAPALAQALAATLRPGTPLDVIPEQGFSTSWTLMSVQVEAAGIVLRLLPSQPFHGQRIQVRLVLPPSAQDPLPIPLGAVRLLHGQATVRVVQGQEITQRAVIVERLDGPNAWISSGLQPGEWVLAE